MKGFITWKIRTFCSKLEFNNNLFKIQINNNFVQNIKSLVSFLKKSKLPTICSKYQNYRPFVQNIKITDHLVRNIKNNKNLVQTINEHNFCEISLTDHNFEQDVRNALSSLILRIEYSVFFYNCLLCLTIKVNVRLLTK